jgi:hypothetical protein
MKKNVRSVKNSLKFKAQPRSGALSVRIGVKKFTVPLDVRILTDGKYIFLSFPACSELFEIHNKELHAMPPDADATDAYAALNPVKKRGRKKSPAVSLPAELSDILKNLPTGYKIGYDADGAPRLVKKRNRGS